MSSARQTDGIALVAVLVALGVLLAMVAPFLLSMGHGDQYARSLVDQKQADWSSASMRDLAIAEAARVNFAFEDDPDAYSWPEQIELGEAFDGLRKNLAGRALLSAEVQDEQRFIDIDSATPLVLANLLGTVTRLRSQHSMDASLLDCDGSLDAFPDAGLLLVGREVIRYGSRDDQSFYELSRGQYAELGFFPAQAFGDHLLPEQALVLDFRCVLALMFPHLGDGDVSTRRPHAAVAELNRIAAEGFPGFDESELAEFEAHCTAFAMREHSLRWGQGERVFRVREDRSEQPRILDLRSAAAFGPGRIVRIRSLDGQLVEHGMVERIDVGGSDSINLPNRYRVALMRPLSLEFEPIDTVVEPLVQVPVNVNRASREVLSALLHELRSRPPGPVREGQQPPQLPPSLSPADAGSLVDVILMMRGDGFDEYQGELPADLDVEASIAPFVGWQDLAERLLPWLVDEDSSVLERLRAMMVYEIMRLGCPGGAEMGGLPICFRSSPMLRYRAAAAQLRHSGREAARVERRGRALAVPGRSLFWGADSQAALEEYIRLDRLSPWWQTWPINTSAVLPTELATVPARRTPAHLAAMLFPDLGFDQPRFPDRSGSEGALRPMPATTPFSGNAGVVLDSFLTALHPEGRDLAQEGAYRILNSGPHANGVVTEQRDNERRIVFPMTEGGGLTGRHAVSFWIRPDRLGEQSLYDLSVGDRAEHNRIEVRLDDSDLIFEVLDEAGLDPDPGLSTAAPEDNGAARWRVPLVDLDLQVGTWYHMSFSALGNRPGQLSFLVDGVPRGAPDHRTYLTQAIEAYQGQESDALGSGRYLTIRVENAEHFPAQGVLRIGHELFEYSSRDDTGFQCQWVDSTGGRRARTRMHEFAVAVPLDESGQPTPEAQQILDDDYAATAPEHAAGAAVELYGYSVPVYPEMLLQVGSGRLSDELGAFAIARAINTSDVEEVLIGSNLQPVPVGQGFSFDWGGDIELGDPLPSASGGMPSPASEGVLAAFPTSGGFALLVQRRLRIGLETANAAELSEAAEVGGVEVLRYGSRSGSKLRGVQRAYALPIESADNEFFDGDETRQFVTDWDERLRVGNHSFDELPHYLTYVVPISIAVEGAFEENPDFVRWLQIHSPDAPDDTEWVRYNLVIDGRHVVRAEQRAWDQLRWALTRQSAIEMFDIPLGGIDLADRITLALDPFPEAPDNGIGGIGHLDAIERDYKAVHVARRALAFRGDLATGTSSHAHAAGATVLPVHRFEFDWAGYGLSAPRTGRRDRVALVQGTAREDGREPGAEWHTVHWVARHYASDSFSASPDEDFVSGMNGQQLGFWPFQLVAFEQPLRTPFIGMATPSGSPENLQDIRLLDRMVKYPSGELPAADVDEVMVGGSQFGDSAETQAIVDEVQVMIRMALPRVLDQQLGEDDPNFFVRPNVTVTPQGAMVDARPRQWMSFGQRDHFPEQGGLLMIDDELMVYSAYDRSSGEVFVGESGRGVLGTEARAHDEGSLVQFIDHVPAAVLAEGVAEGDHEIVLQSRGLLPPHGGTVLIGTELLHYTWTVGDDTLGMPRWFEEPSRDQGDDQGDDEDGRRERRGRGLFRGRYGTAAVGASAGAPVIFFPIRYWDRYRPQAVDPECSFVQVSLDHGPAWFDSFGWREESFDDQVDLLCYLRLDGRGSFADDPQRSANLFLFEEGEPQGEPNRIGRHATRFEARFVHRYNPGAFDPITFQAQDWKRAPTLRWYALMYEGETRILSEEVTAR